VILREALHAYYLNGTPVEDTINNCNEFIKFQKMVMVSSKYTCAVQGFPTVIKKKVTNVVGTKLKEKHIRWFASNNPEHGGLFKISATTGNYSKVTDSPPNLFIVNDNITEAKCSDYPELDKEFYIKMAQSRVKRFADIAA
jgi:hypothetical protein